MIALYPSIIRLYNIYKATLLGQLVMDKHDINSREKRVVDDRYNRGSKYLDDLEINEALHFCYRWLNLPNVMSTIKYFDEKYGDKSLKKVKVKKIMTKEDLYKGLKRVKIKKVI